MAPVEAHDLKEVDAQQVWDAVVVCYGKTSHGSAKDLAADLKEAFLLLHPRPHDG